MLDCKSQNKNGTVLTIIMDTNGQFINNGNLELTFHIDPRTQSIMNP
jgi:hypothetical protein